MGNTKIVGDEKVTLGEAWNMFVSDKERKSWG